MKSVAVTTNVTPARYEVSMSLNMKSCSQLRTSRGPNWSNTARSKKFENFFFFISKHCFTPSELEANFQRKQDQKATTACGFYRPCFFYKYSIINFFKKKNRVFLLIAS